MPGKDCLHRQVGGLPEGSECRQAIESAEVLNQERDALNTLAHPALELFTASTSKITGNEQTLVKGPFGILKSLKSSDTGKRQSRRSVRVIGRSADSTIVDQQPSLGHPHRNDRNASRRGSRFTSHTDFLGPNLSSLGLCVSVYEEQR